MGVPVSQMWTVATYVIAQKLRRTKRYPLVLMLEPLFRCNLACAGCGKIQYPKEILQRHLTVEQCLAAVDECGAPIVSIPGGEPLLHPDIDKIVQGIVARRKYVYLCTNALPLMKKMDLFKPSRFLTFSIHLDGSSAAHDASVCKEGVYGTVVATIRELLKRGFRVTTNTTLFEDADPNAVRAFFDDMMDLGIEGMTISPGYPYKKAPDQDNFLRRKATRSLFSMILSNRDKGRRRWRFNQSPLFLEFLTGKREYECTPWGNPTYNLFGWQKPCYLLGEGYVQTFQQLIDDTDWDSYGTGSGNYKCTDCMVHCGYEPTAVDHTFSGLAGFAATVKSMLNRRHRDPDALRRLANYRPRPHHQPVVKLTVTGTEAVSFAASATPQPATKITEDRIAV